MRKLNTAIATAATLLLLAGCHSGTAGPKNEACKIVLHPTEVQGTLDQTANRLDKLADQLKTSDPQLSDALKMMASGIKNDDGESTNTAAEYAEILCGG